MANYTVGVKLGMRTKAVTIEAEDALVAALKIKLENPEALLGWKIRFERFLIRGFQAPRYAVAGLALAAIVSVTLFAQMHRVSAGPVATAAVFEDENTLRRPDFRGWKIVDSTAHNEPHDFERAYINPSAYREFAQTGKFPEGTVLVLQSGQPKSPLLASVKNGRFEGGWGYFEFREEAGRAASKATALPESAGCNACHRDRGATDHVFTQFYPVLRSVLGVL